MKVRVLRIKNQSEVERQIKEVGSYPKSVKIMSLKAQSINIKLKDISSVSANILKQEMLSLGGEVAVSKDVISKNVKKSDCLIFGTILQINRLCEKLKNQPLDLDKIGKHIKDVLDKHQRNDFKLKCRKYTLDLSKRTYICGVLNITPDSFSDGGRFLGKDKAIEHGLRLEKEGADIIDIGGESTRPGAKKYLQRNR